MELSDELKRNINTEKEIMENEDLIKKSRINEYDVPENLLGIKNRINGVLNFRDENKDLNPNCNELTDLLIDLNNALAKELKSENPDIDSCENIKKSFCILYDNVINHALIVTSKVANKDSNLYNLFETLKGKLDIPKRINLETKEYLKVMSGVNFFQREKMADGEVVYPNECEKMIISESSEYDIPEDLKLICSSLEHDIQNPEKMKEEIEILK